MYVSFDASIYPYFWHNSGKNGSNTIEIRFIWMIKYNSGYIVIVTFVSKEKLIVQKNSTKHVSVSKWV